MATYKYLYSNFTSLPSAWSVGRDGIQLWVCVDVRTLFVPKILTMHTLKRSRRFYGKYWELAANTCTGNFTGACRLFTVIITHGRAA